MNTIDTSEDQCCESLKRSGPKVGFGCVRSCEQDVLAILGSNMLV